MNKIEFKKVLKGTKWEIGNPNHIRAAELLNQIAYLERSLTRNNVNKKKVEEELKRTRSNCAYFLTKDDELHNESRGDNQNKE